MDENTDEPLGGHKSRYSYLGVDALFFLETQFKDLHLTIQSSISQFLQKPYAPFSSFCTPFSLINSLVKSVRPQPLRFRSLVSPSGDFPGNLHTKTVDFWTGFEVPNERQSTEFSNNTSLIRTNNESHILDHGPISRLASPFPPSFHQSFSVSRRGLASRSQSHRLSLLACSHSPGHFSREPGRNVGRLRDSELPLRRRQQRNSYPSRPSACFCTTRWLISSHSWVELTSFLIAPS